MRIESWSTNRVLGVLAAAALVYLPFVGNGFLYDDYLVVLGPEVPTSPSGWWELLSAPYYLYLPYHRPLTTLGFVLPRALLGDGAWHFHLVNIALAAGCGALTWSLLRLPRLAVRPHVALVGAVALVLHPVTSSVVLPISGRDTLQATFFLLAALWFFLRSRRTQDIVLGSTAFAAALASKEIAVALPALVLLAELTGVGPLGRNNRSLVRTWAPIAAVLAAWWLVRRSVLGSVPVAAGDPLDVGLSLLFAAQTTLTPTALLQYEPDPAVWLSPWRTGLALLCAGGAAVAARRSPRRAPLMFWAGFAVLSLLPTANLVSQETRFADRYVLLPLIGVLAFLATLLDGVPSSRRLAGAAGAVLVLLGTMSMFRGPNWEQERFYPLWMQSSPSRVEPRYNYGMILEQRGEHARALELYEAALALDPTRAQTHHRLGLSKRSSDPAAALRHFAYAAGADPEQPRYQHNYATELIKQGRVTESVEPMRRAMDLEPTPERALALGQVYRALGRPDLAERAWRAGLALDSGHDELLLEVERLTGPSMQR